MTSILSLYKRLNMVEDEIIETSIWTINIWKWNADVNYK